MKKVQYKVRFKTIIFLLLVFLHSTGNLFAQSGKESGILFQCTPCGSDCDTLTFSNSGKCPHCRMDLVKKPPVEMKSIRPSEICGYLKKNPGVMLLDVRTKEEFEGKGTPDFGTLKGAVNIPIQQLEARLGELAGFKEKEIIVYCSHSQRSPRAAYLLLKKGFAKVTNMAGGMSTMKDKSCKK